MLPIRVCVDSRTIDGTSITTVIGANEDISSFHADIPIKRKGNGTPSASNIRGFVLWDEVTIYDANDNVIYHGTFDAIPQGRVTVTSNAVVSGYGYIASYNGEELLDEWYSDRDADGSASPTLGAEVVYALGGHVSEDVTVSVPFPTYAVGDEFTADGVIEGGAYGDYGSASGIIATIPPTISVTEDGVAYTPSERKATSLEVELEPIQSGSGTPSPTNIRPISGHTEVGAYVTGKNLFNGVWESGALNTNTGEERPSTASIRTKMIPLVGGNTYSLSWGSGSLYILVNAYKADGSFSRYIGAKTANPSSIILNAGEAFIRYFTYNNIVEPPNMQLELGSTATAYEPYNSDTYTTALGRTVYGGTVDIVSGVLTVDRAYIASYNGETIGEPWISSMDEYVAGTAPSTGAQVVYKLATPQTYQLTPQEVTLLLGENNVWSDSGNIEMAYRTLFDAELTPNLEVVIGRYEEYEGQMCGGTMTPTFTSNKIGVVCESIIECDEPTECVLTELHTPC